MAYPAPVSTGTTSTLVFLLTAESGIEIESFSRKTGSKEVQIYNGALGYTDGAVFHDFFADYDIKGKILATPAGVSLASPGVTVTVANVSTGNGVTSGGIYTRSTSLDHSGEQLRDFTCTAKQLPGIT